MLAEYPNLDEAAAVLASLPEDSGEDSWGDSPKTPPESASLGSDFAATMAVLLPAEHPNLGVRPGGGVKSPLLPWSPPRASKKGSSYNPPLQKKGGGQAHGTRSETGKVRALHKPPDLCFGLNILGYMPPSGIGGVVPRPESVDLWGPSSPEKNEKGYGKGGMFDMVLSLTQRQSPRGGFEARLEGSGSSSGQLMYMQEMVARDQSIPVLDSVPFIGKSVPDNALLRDLDEAGIQRFEFYKSAYPGNLTLL